MPSNRRLRYHWGPLLKQARLDAGLSQKALSQQLGIAQEVISRWENGVYAPSDANRLRLAQALGKTVVELFPYYDLPDDDDADGGQAA